METQQNLSFGAISSVDRESPRLAFKLLLNEAVDNVFSSLGPVCRQAIYDYLETKCKLEKNEIADHTMEFSEALERIFGDGAALLEIQIMEELCRKVPQFKHKPEGTLTFPDYVCAVSRFLNNRRIK